MGNEARLIRDVTVCLKIAKKLAERGGYSMLLYLIDLALLECGQLAEKAR